MLNIIRNVDMDRTANKYPFMKKVLMVLLGAFKGIFLA
mgnify:CR=1 FL=1